MLFWHHIYRQSAGEYNLYFVEHIGLQSNNETFILYRVFDIIKSESWELSIKHIYIFIFCRYVSPYFKNLSMNLDFFKTKTIFVTSNVRSEN